MPAGELRDGGRAGLPVTLWPDELWPVVTVDRSAEPYRIWAGGDVIDPLEIPVDVVERYERALAELLEARDALVAEWRRRGGVWWPEREL